MRMQSSSPRASSRASPSVNQFTGSARTVSALALPRATPSRSVRSASSRYHSRQPRLAAASSMARVESLAYLMPAMGSITTARFRSTVIRGSLSPAACQKRDATGMAGGIPIC